MRLRPGGREGLREGESIEAGNVALFPASQTPARMLDRWRFLTETEKAYFDDMYAHVKQELGCRALVTGTIVFGPCGLYAQSGMDYIDGHAYWQHPRFPGRPWDPGNWTVEQKAMVDHPEESPLFRLAAQRLAGKPYTVSEYNHPAPNDYQAECVPMIASFAAEQDWDGVWLFAYSHRTDDWDRQHFSSFFDIQANPAKWGFVPAGSIIFRQGGLGSLPQAKVVSLADGPDVLNGLAAIHVKHGRDVAAAVAERAGLSWPDMLRARVAVQLTDQARTRSTTQQATGAITWRKGLRGQDGRQIVYSAYEALGPRAHVWIGYLAEPAIGVDLVVAHAPGGTPPFAVITETALDGEALNDSRRILVVACGRCENTGMVFSDDRRTVGRKWGGPPVRIEPVRVALSASWMQHPQSRCQALGPDGRVASKVEFSQAGSGSRYLDLDRRHKTMWYLLTRE